MSDPFPEMHPAVRAESRRRGPQARDVRIDSPEPAVSGEDRPKVEPAAAAGRLGGEAEPDELVNTFQAAKILGCSTSHVRKLVAAGKLPAPSIVEPGHMRMHRRSALHAYIADTSAAPQ